MRNFNAFKDSGLDRFFGERFNFVDGIDALVDSAEKNFICPNSDSLKDSCCSRLFSQLSLTTDDCPLAESPEPLKILLVKRKKSHIGSIATSYNPVPGSISTGFLRLNG